MYCRMLGCIPGICRDGSCHLPKMSQGLAKCPRLGRGVQGGAKSLLTEANAVDSCSPHQTYFPSLLSCSRMLRPSVVHTVLGSASLPG